MFSTLSNHIKSQQRFKSEAHNVYSEEINEISLGSNGDQTLQVFGRITSYPYDASIGQVIRNY